MKINEEEAGQIRLESGILFIREGSKWFDIKGKEWHLAFSMSPKGYGIKARDKL